VLLCLGAPASVRIPAAVREIADSALANVISLVDLSFEEGIVRIGNSAFFGCTGILAIHFPASLEIIDAEAFFGCMSLTDITFAEGSRLRCIQNHAFSLVPLNSVALPASIREVDAFLFGFSEDVWEFVKFDGPPLFLVDGDFVFSPDSGVIFRYLGDADVVHIDAVVGNGTTVKEFGELAFVWSDLRGVIVPSSVETIGDRCFARHTKMETITFEEPAMLKRIGEYAFRCCGLRSITIPASTEEIDGSAFVECALSEIVIAPENRKFAVEGNFLITSDGTEIVRYFGLGRDVIVPLKVEVLGKSCFESCRTVENVTFENGSQLRIIGPSALSGCKSLTIIAIPASVVKIEDEAFSQCNALEYCIMDESSSLISIGKKSFMNCRSLRSFDVPRSVEGLGKQCFESCYLLYRLVFVSVESVKRVVGDLALDDVVEEMMGADIWSGFRIEVNHSDVSFVSPGWLSVVDENSHLTLVRSG
jgi:hypothetical protein